MSWTGYISQARLLRRAPWFSSPGALRGASISGLLRRPTTAARDSFYGTDDIEDVELGPEKIIRDRLADEARRLNRQANEHLYSLAIKHVLIQHERGGPKHAQKVRACAWCYWVILRVSQRTVRMNVDSPRTYPSRPYTAKYRDR